MINRCFIISIILCLSFCASAQFEESEKLKLKYLVNYLIEQGDLEKCDVTTDNFYDLITIRNLKWNEKLSKYFMLKKFTKRGCEDCRYYIFIESKHKIEVFDLCNVGIYYTRLFSYLHDYSSELTQDEILTFLRDVSNEINLISSPSGYKNDGKYKSYITCF